MSRFRAPAQVGPDEKAWLDQWPRPHLLLALGGNTKDVELPQNEVVAATSRLGARAKDLGGSLLIVGSPRTDPELLQAVDPEGILVPTGGPSFAALLDDADEIFVTGDSISMLSEAMVTGKPVGMISARLTETGLRGVGEAHRGPLDFRSPQRDPRRFWAQLQELGLVGTVDEPRSSHTVNPVQLAAEAVRKLLGDAREDVATAIAVN